MTGMSLSLASLLPSRRLRGPRRRTHLLAALALALCGFLAGPAAAEHPATFMQRVANELVAAGRSNNPTLFAATIRRHADVPTLGISSLGTYAARMPKQDRPAYFNGMIKFMSNYASKEAPKYPVARAIVLGATEETASGAHIDTRVELRDGTTYDVRWLVVRRGDGWKVRDAQVLGFWMSPFMKNLFENYISENGGNPQALIVALNR